MPLRWGTDLFGGNRVKRLASMFETSTVSREHALIEELLHENDVLRRRYREACRQWDQQMHSLNATVKSELQRKVDACRQRWQLDKSKEHATIKEQMQSDFDQRLNTLVKMKEKEIRQLRAQLSRMQQTAAKARTLNAGSKANLCDSRVSLKGSSTDVHADPGSVWSMCRRCQLTVDESQAKIASLDRQLSLCKQSEHHLKQQLQTVDLTTKQQMRQMAAEFRQKSKEAAELDRSLRQLQTQSLEMGPSKGNQQQLSACKCDAEREKFEAKFGDLETRLKTLQEDNSSVKEAFAAKCEEIASLQQQHSDALKSNAALKQAAMEKDRRFDHLLRRYRRMRRSKVTSDVAFFDEDATMADSSMSVSSNSLDTIVEDWEEFAKEELEENYRHLAREHTELQRAYAAVLEQKKMDALKMARSKSQSSLNVQSQLCDAQTKLKQMEALVDNLRQQVTEAKEENELLEFQLLEHKHNPPVKEAMEKSTSTTDIDDFGEQIDLDADIGMPLDELKMRFTLLKHRRELRPDDRRVVAQMRRLSEQLEQDNEQLRQSESLLKKRESELAAELQRLTAEKVELAQQSATIPKQKNSRKMKELEKSLKDREAEIERLRKLVNESSLKQSGVNVLDLQRQIERQQVQMQSRQAEVALLQTAIEAKNQELDRMRRSVDQQSTDWNQVAQQKATLAKLETANDFNKVRIAELEVEANEAAAALKAKDADLCKANQRLEQLENKLSTFAADNQILLGTIDKEQQAKADLLRQISRLKDTNRSGVEMEQKHRECRQKLRESKQLLAEHEQLQQRYQERVEKLLEKTKAQQGKLLKMQADYVDAQKKLDQAREDRAKMQSSAQELYLERQENKKLSELLKKCQSELVLLGSNGAKREVDTFSNEKVGRISDQVRSDSLNIAEFESKESLMRKEMEKLRQIPAEENDCDSKGYEAKIAQLQEFNKQLESQFNVQLRIVDYLKDELKRTQHALGEKCQKFDEATLTKLKLQQQIEDINESQKQFHAKVDKNLAKVEAEYALKLENGVDFSKQLTRLMLSAADQSSSGEQILTKIRKLRELIDERQQSDAKEHLDALTVLLQRLYDLPSSNRRDGVFAAQSLHISLDESEEKSVQPAVHRWTDSSRTLQQILQTIKAAAADGDCQSLLPALISSIESQLANESPAVSSPSSGFSGSLDSPQENGITLVLDGRTAAANGTDHASDA